MSGCEWQDNAAGYVFLDGELMTQVVTEYLDNAEREGFPEDGEDHKTAPRE